MRIAITQLLVLGAAHAATMAGASTAPPNTTLDAVVQATRADAEQRAGAQAAVRSIDSVTWRDGSLGCPQPGRLYTQALVPGYRIRIEAGGQVLDYHAGRSGQPVLCPAERSVEPSPSDASRT